MRKDESGVHEWCKHTRNACGTGKRGVNKRARLHVKDSIRDGLQKDEPLECGFHRKRMISEG